MTKQSFEESIQALEQIVKELETGELPLEKALEKFEQGVKLTEYCSAKLDEAEKRVTLLMQDKEGKVSEKPFFDEDKPS